MVSLWLRSGGSLKHVIRQLKDIGSSLQVSTKEGKIMSLGDGLARALLKYSRAKEMFGLKSLLLGEMDLAEIEGAARKVAGGNGNGPKTPAKPSMTTVSGNTDRDGSPSPWRRGFTLKCPECGGALSFQEGCAKCHGCGYAQC